MRKAIFIAIALVAALALSVGAFAYPVLVGSRSLGQSHSAAPATTNHPTGGDNSTGNETNDNETDHHTTPPAENETENETGDNDTAPVPPAPEANETENESEMGNVSVEHNVTVTQVGNVTYINGTIVVTQGNVTLVDVSFQIVNDHNGTVNVTFSHTNTVNGVDVVIHGTALLGADERSGFVFGTVTATQNGTLQWERMFAFDLSGAGSSCG